MTATDRDMTARQQFLDIDETTREQLREAWRVLEPELDGILDGFYAKVLGEPGLAEKVGGAHNVPRLKAAQTEHWRALFSATFDDAYMQRVTTVGMTHMRIGLEPRWYMGAYAFVLNRLTELAAKVSNKNTEKMAAMMKAVTKAVFLDMDLAIDTYFRAVQDDARAKLTEHADRFEADVMDMVDIVASSATELQATSQSMAVTAEQVGAQSNAASEASSMASSNVQTVASASEELSSSIQEISRLVGEAITVADAAMKEGESTQETVGQLSEASTKIGDVVKLISDIAGQTNLLALNATIEAARAGEAGKGFAVVASEVKSLATQTAKATEEISAQITEMQTWTQGTVMAIETITKTISKINEISTAISAAVEEQGAATSEISRSASEAAQGTDTVSSNISSVNQAASEAGKSANEVLEAASGLSQQSEKLKDSVSSFLIEIRAS